MKMLRLAAFGDLDEASWGEAMNLTLVPPGGR